MFDGDEDCTLQVSVRLLFKPVSCTHVGTTDQSYSDDEVFGGVQSLPGSNQRITLTLELDAS